MEVANNVTGHTIKEISAHSGNSKLIVTSKDSLKTAVFELRGAECEKCGSEEDLELYQVRTTKWGTITPADYVVKCEVCATKRADADAQYDRDDWFVPFGKWKDYRISECPTGYLDWLRKQDWLRDPLRKRINIHMQQIGL
ncbi:hypothetical protein LCGC14_3123430 [marine sediment metagenome]|uniref:Uncharacterized protein n=1 Tax=marine sediment metagenome TaxID=412755 RepID=A0A0F8YRE9_9ZZZZ